MITRFLKLSKLLEKKSILLLGPRATGKSQLIHSLANDFKNCYFFDLLKGSSFQRYISDPGLFGAEVRHLLKKSSELTLIIVDEIQKIPALLDEVHSLIEEYKNQVRFILTGSSARKLKKSGANLLAGRALVKFLHPLSSLELSINFDRALQFGTLPEVYLEEDLSIEILESYTLTYLKEEIQQEALTRNLGRFSKFLEIAAQMNAEPINFTKLAKQIGVTNKTAIDYFSILEDTLITMRIDGWAESVRHQLLQAPKYYFFDCGVLNALTGELRTELKTSSYRFGKLFETFVIQELRRLNDYLALGYRFHYWRSENSEVDLIVSRTLSKPLFAIEIKSAFKRGTDEVKGLKIFQTEYTKVKLLCICRTEVSYGNEGIDFVSLQEALQILQGV